MKRRKKQTDAAGQLSLFETAPVRQEEETRRAPKIKPAEALKTAAPTLIPPRAVEAPRAPENSLKTEILDRDALNRLWKENPEVLHALNRMAKKNPAVLRLVRRFILVPFCILLLFSCGKPVEDVIPPEEDTFSAPMMEQAVSFLAALENWHDPVKNRLHGLWEHRICYDNARRTFTVKVIGNTANKVAGLPTGTRKKENSDETAETAP